MSGIVENANNHRRPPLLAHCTALKKYPRFWQRLGFVNRGPLAYPLADATPSPVSWKVTLLVGREGYLVPSSPIVMCCKFGDDRFRGFASAEGQILPFPIDFDGRPYSTLTLPCEYVISVFTHWSVAPSACFACICLHLRLNDFCCFVVIHFAIRPKHCYKLESF